MPTTIRARDAREILSLIPYQLGFQPEDSVVLLGVRGPRSRTGLVVRVDVDDLAHPREGPELAAALADHLRTDGSTRFLAVVYRAVDVRHHPDAVVTRAVRHLTEATSPDLDLLETWGVGTEGYYELGCHEPRCCPPGGRPLAGLSSTAVSAAMVLEGVTVAPTRGDVGKILPVDADARRAARKAARRWAARGASVETMADLHRWRAEGLGLWRAEHRRLLGERATAGQPDGALPAGRTTPAVVLGRLQAALDDVVVRDAVMIDLVPGSERASDVLVAGDDHPVVGAALAKITDPDRAIEPDREWSRAATDVLEAVVAHSTRAGHVPSLTLLGMLAWWQGDGARASVLVDRALAADPEYRLAVLFGDLFARGTPPGWVGGRRSREV